MLLQGHLGGIASPERRDSKLEKKQSCDIFLMARINVQLRCVSYADLRVLSYLRIPDNFYNLVIRFRHTPNARQAKSQCSGSTRTTVLSGSGSTRAICEAADWNQANPSADTPGKPDWLPKLCGFEAAP